MQCGGGSNREVASTTNAIRRGIIGDRSSRLQEKLLPDRAQFGNRRCDAVTRSCELVNDRMSRFDALFSGQTNGQPVASKLRHVIRKQMKFRCELTRPNRCQFGGSHFEQLKFVRAERTRSRIQLKALKQLGEQNRIFLSECVVAQEFRSI